MHLNARDITRYEHSQQFGPRWQREWNQNAFPAISWYGFMPITISLFYIYIYAKIKISFELRWTQEKEFLRNDKKNTETHLRLINIRNYASRRVYPASVTWFYLLKESTEIWWNIPLLRYLKDIIPSETAIIASRTTNISRWTTWWNSGSNRISIKDERERSDCGYASNHNRKITAVITWWRCWRKVANTVRSKIIVVGVMAAGDGAGGNGHIFSTTRRESCKL